MANADGIVIRKHLDTDDFDIDDANKKIHVKHQGGSGDIKTTTNSPLQNGDAGKLWVGTGRPLHAPSSAPIGYYVDIIGPTTVRVPAGDTLRSKKNVNRVLPDENARLVKTGANEWALYGSGLGVPPAIYTVTNVLGGKTYAVSDCSNLKGTFVKFEGNWFYVAKSKSDLSSKTAQWDNPSYSGDPHKALSITDDNNNTHSIPADHIITSCVTDMRDLFRNASDFDQYIGSWDTSNVTTMRGTFWNAHNFNQSIGGWDTSNVITMYSMFFKASTFNKDIGNWDTGNVTSMTRAFREASHFNQDIGGWDTSNVATMHETFQKAFDFNQDIGSWDTSRVNDMTEMFRQAHDFNQNISSWDTSQVTTMTRMFRDATAFDQDISGWCVSLIGSKPSGFDANSGFAGQTSKQPDWGAAC